MQVLKVLGSVIGVGFAIAQVVGTTSGIMAMKTLEGINESSNIAAVKTHHKMIDTLNKAEYSSFLQDEYLTSTAFRDSVGYLGHHRLSPNADKDFTAAYDKLLREIKEEIVSPYPLTSFAFKDLEKSLNSQPAIDKVALNKYMLLLAAKSSCAVEKSALVSAYPEAVRLGEKYFCG